MDSPSDIEKQQALASNDRPSAFLSGPPKSGESSPFALKIAAEAFVCLCSVVVFGSTADYKTQARPCTSLCKFGIATGVISFLISGVILVGQLLILTNRAEKSGWFSPKAEQKGMIFLSVWWIIGVAFLSALEPFPGTKLPIPHASGIGIIFGWLALFGSIFASYKAYHALEEEKRSLRYVQDLSLQEAEDEEYANFS